MRRVVVTGMGAITHLGLNVKDFFENVKAGNHGFGMISKFDASEYKAHVAAEVKGFVAKEFMDFKAAKRMEPFSQYAVAAAKEAMEQAGLESEARAIVFSLPVTETAGMRLIEDDDFQHGGRKCIYCLRTEG